MEERGDPAWCYDTGRDLFSREAGLASGVRRELLSVDENLPVNRIVTMDKILTDSIATRRFVLFLFGLFAAMSLLLASLGIYSVLAYVVTQRTQEISIRMALGAQYRHVFSLVVGHGMAMVAIGMALGMAGAFAATRLMAQFLYEVSTTDLATYVGVAVAVAVVALIACYRPARRATQVDPMTAWRYELLK